jgi:hypothetical protein
MGSLPAHAGAWIGTNGFRLMPTDSPHVAAATADVSTAAAGNLLRQARDRGWEGAG